MKRFWQLLPNRPVAMIAVITILILYLLMAFCEFLAPYGPQKLFEKHSHHPPNITWYSQELGFGPQVQTMLLKNEISREYVRVKGEYTPLKWFVTGDDVRLWGFIPTRFHLFGTDFKKDLEGKAQPVFLLGTDNLGRDVFSRILYGTRISLTIGFVSVAISLTLGLFFGGLAGYFGGFWDWLIMRFAELLILIPGLYLILFLRSVWSQTLDSGQSYMLITIILSFIGWPGSARMIRGMVHSIKRNDFIANAQLESMPTIRIIFKHIIPQMSSILIIGATLSVPGFILGETALSYLGLGIVDPAVSWGSMLNRDATTTSNLLQFPWLISPGIFLLFLTLSFVFLGELLRDALDPHWKEKTRG